MDIKNELHLETKGEGHLLVLIHAGVLSSRMWDNQLEAFAKHYKVICYDARGFGKSKPIQRAYSPSLDLYRLLQDLGVNESNKAHLVSLSMGGKTAIDFALQCDEWVSALVLASSAFDACPRPLSHQKKWKEIAEKGNYTKAVGLYLQGDYMDGSPVNPVARKKVEEILKEDENSNPFTLKRELMQWLNPPVSRLEEIKVPTLVIRGQADNDYVRGVAYILKESISGASGYDLVDIPNAGHMVNLERPEEFNQAVLNFLVKSVR